MWNLIFRVDRIIYDGVTFVILTTGCINNNNIASSTPNPQSAKVERTKKFSRRRQQLLSNALFSVGPILVIECKNDWRSFLRNCNIANLRSLAIVIVHFFMARIRRKWLHASVTRWLHNDFIFDQLQLAQCIRRLPK